jgi:O-antigen ligase
MKRQHYIFVLTLAALFGSLIGVFTTLQARDFQLRGYVDASQEVNLPFRVPRFGVNVELAQYTDEQLRENLDFILDIHATWIRQIFPWDEIELVQGQYDWSKWDSIVETVSEYPDLQLVAVLMYSPQWARSPGAEHSRTSPPKDPKQFADFAQAFAERYGDIVDYYQVWDEPNLTETWGELEPKTADYVALLRETYTAVHGADESAVVIAGALSPTTETGPKNISDILYLRDMYALGAKPYFDGIGAKPYGFSTSPLDRNVEDHMLNFSRIVALREEMVRNNDGQRAIWAMNWGWNSLPDDWTGNPSIWGNVRASQQTEYTLAALARVEREWPWLAGMILHHWQPNAQSDDPVWGFSIIDQNSQPTPLYHVLAQYQEPQSASNGLFAATNPYTRYTGVWTLGEMGADVGWVQDSQFDFDFWGESVSLLLRQDDYVAYLYPTIDGYQANAVPRDASGNAYVVLTSNTLRPELSLVPIGKGLSDAQHTLHAVADRGWDRWAIAGFGVSSGDLSRPYQQQLTVAWITVLISSLSVFMAARQINWLVSLQPLRALYGRLTSLGQLIVTVITSTALLIGMLLTFGDGSPNIFRREPIQLSLAVITAGIIYLEPGFIITIATSIILFIIIYNRIEIGLILTVFWAPFFLFPVELYEFALPMSELMVLLTGAAWILRQLAAFGRARQAQISQFSILPSTLQLRRLNIVDYGVLIWCLAGILSLIWSQYPQQAFTQLRVMILEPALFYVVFRTSVYDTKMVVRIVDVLLLSGFIVAVIGLWQFGQGEAVITAEAGARRLASVYGSPNNVGLFLGRCLPFALAFVIAPLSRSRRLLSGIFVGVISLAILLSQSVGAIFIGVPASIIVVIVFSWGKKARYILIPLLGIFALVFIFSLQSERFARVLEFDSGTNFYRIRVWQSALNVIRDYPITGLGLDQFLYAFRGHYIMPDAWQEPNLSHPHNEILDFWISLGILGIIVFLYLQFGFWRNIREALNLWRSHPMLLAIMIGTSGSMVNLLTHGLIDNSVFVQDLCYVFVLLLALSSQLSNTRAIDEPVR